MRFHGGDTCRVVFVFRARRGRPCQNAATDPSIVEQTFAVRALLVTVNDMKEIGLERETHQMR